MSSLDLSSILRDSEIQISNKLNDSAIHSAIRTLAEKTCPPSSDDADASAISVNSSYSQQRARLKPGATARSDPSPRQSTTYSGHRMEPVFDAVNFKPRSMYPPVNLSKQDYRQVSHEDLGRNFLTDWSTYRSTSEGTPDLSHPLLSFTLQRRLSSLFSGTGSGISAAAGMSVVELNSFLESSKQFSSPEIDEILIFFEYQRLAR
jgi:hypothetical protein